MNTAEQYTKNGHKVTIFYDETGDNSPRDWDNLGNLFCFHRRYNIGDPHQYDSSDFTSFEDWKNQIQKDYKVIAILPVYMYDHSGISISTNPFACRWDSGQIGWIFTTPEKLKEIGAEKFKELERICNELQQDAIAYKAGRKTGLIFNTDYTGERYQFNKSFFNNL